MQGGQLILARGWHHHGGSTVARDEPDSGGSGEKPSAIDGFGRDVFANHGGQRAQAAIDKEAAKTASCHENAVMRCGYDPDGSAVWGAGDLPGAAGHADCHRSLDPHGEFSGRQSLQTPHGPVPNALRGGNRDCQRAQIRCGASRYRLTREPKKHPNPWEPDHHK